MMPENDDVTAHKFNPLPVFERIRKELSRVLTMQGVEVNSPKKAKDNFTLNDVLDWYRDRHPVTFERLDAE